jgi:hypothetical protein
MREKGSVIMAQHNLEHGEPVMGTGGGLMGIPSTPDFEPGTGSVTDDTSQESPEAQEALEREGVDKTAWPGQEGWTGDPGSGSDTPDAGTNPVADAEHILKPDAEQ